MGRKIANIAKIRTLQDLATLLEAGTPLHQGLLILANQSANKQLERVLRELYEHTATGSPLYTILHRYRELFTETEAEMMKAAEKTDMLLETLVHIIEYSSRGEELKQKIKSAMIYPAALLGLMFVTFTGLFIFLVPKFMALYEELTQGGELPALTKGIVVIGRLMPWIMPGMIIASMVSYIVCNRSGLVQRGLMKVPKIGPLILKQNLAQYAYALGTLLNNGIPIIQAMKLATSTVGVRELRVALQKTEVLVHQGHPVAYALDAQGIFPGAFTQMIHVAENSASLPQTLILVAKNYFKETHESMQRMTKLLEPTLIALMAILIGIIMAGLFLPLSQLIDNLPAF